MMIFFFFLGLPFVVVVDVVVVDIGIPQYISFPPPPPPPPPAPKYGDSLMAAAAAAAAAATAADKESQPESGNRKTSIDINFVLMLLQL